jgi:WD40 repeat protein
MAVIHIKDPKGTIRYPDIGGTLGAATTKTGPDPATEHSAISPDGLWLAIALTASPYIAISPVAEDVIGDLSSPTGGDIPAGQGNKVAWSPNGDYVFLGHNTAPYLSAWSWDGTWGTKIAPGTNPGANVLGISVSRYGGYVAVVTATTPFLSVYPWTGAFGSRVQPVAPNIQAGAGADVIFSRSGKWIIVAHTTTPYVSAWRWDDGELGPIKNPADLATGNGLAITTSRDGLFIAIAQTGTPYVRAWRWRDTRKAQPFDYLVDDPETIHDHPVLDLSWDYQGGFIFVSDDVSTGGSLFMAGYAWGRGGWGRRFPGTASLDGIVTGMSFPADDEFVYASVDTSASQDVLHAIDRKTTNWFNWNKRVKCEPAPVSVDYRNRRFFTGDGEPKKTGNDIAIPGTGSPAKLPAESFNMGVKSPGLLTVDNDADPPVVTTPSVPGGGLGWHPNGKFLAVTITSAPYVQVWDMSDPEYPLLFPDPATPPTSAPTSVRWSPEGDYLALSLTSTPFVFAYPFTDAGFGAKIADPATLPTGLGQEVAWSPDGNFIGIAHNTTPGVSVYPWTGVFGVKIVNPATVPVDGYSLSWSHDGNTLVVSGLGTPFIFAYPWDGTFGTKYADPAVLAPSNSFAVAFSRDDKHIAMGHNLAPFIAVWPFSSAGFGTKIEDPTPLPAPPSSTGTPGTIEWSPNGDYIGVGMTSSPVIAIYEWNPTSTDKRVEYIKTVEKFKKVTQTYTVTVDDGEGLEHEEEREAFTMVPYDVETNEVKTITVEEGFGEKIPNPERRPEGASGRGISWHPDGIYLVAAYGSGASDVEVFPWLSTITERHYCFTYVTGWGEESAPCVPQAIDEKNFNTPKLTFPVEELTGYNITHRRIYRIVAGETGASFLFVAEIPISQTTYSDYLLNKDLGGVLVTNGWAEPPSNLQGLTTLQNGFMVGFAGKILCFSEPNAPYAWPIRYRRAVPHKPLAIGAVGDAVIVATDGRPVIYQGDHPAKMAMRVMSARQSCVSPESLVEGSGGVAFATPDGLFYFGPNGEAELTKDIMSKADWKALNPSTMVGAIYDGRYYGFYDSDGAGVYKALVLDPQAIQEGLRFDENTGGASLTNVAFSDLETDTLYLVIAGVINKWDDDAGSPLTSTWKSKVFPQRKPINLGWLQVRASFPGTVTVLVYGGGTLRATKAVTSDAPVRLPTGFLAAEYEIQVSSTIAWKEIVLTSTMKEMREVL